MLTQEKLMTLDEFHEFIDAAEQRDRHFELIEGTVIEKMASFTPSRIAMRIGRFLANFGDDIGYVTGADGSYILSPHDEFMPDVGFILRARLPTPPEREVEGPPDLAVEVKSPTDNKRDMRMKAETYIRLGTRMVWLVFPDEQRVEVYLSGRDVIELAIDDVLEGGDVLPGFELPLRDLFAL
jgi:Uma2 family endonuclease